MEESRFRNKIHWFTYGFSLLVVWVHAYNADLFSGSGRISAAIERMLGEALGQVAVPGFFMISAYLFYRNFRWEKLWYKWSSRVKSVLLPYLSWNVLYYLAYAAAGYLPALRGLVDKGKIPLSLSVLADAAVNYTYNPVFWYLYQLILLIALAPVIYLAVRNAWIGAIFLLSLLCGIYAGADLPGLNLDALFYYSSAAYAAAHGKHLVENGWDKRRRAVGVLLFAAAAALYGYGAGHFKVRFLVLSTVLYRFSIPLALWLAVREKRLPPAASWMKNNFFLYAIHFALVRTVNKLGAMAFGQIPGAALCFFLLMPALVTAVCQLMSRFLRRYLPAAWNLLSGGR